MRRWTCFIFVLVSGITLRLEFIVCLIKNTWCARFVSLALWSCWLSHFRLNLSRCDSKKISIKGCNKSFRFCHKPHMSNHSSLLFGQRSCVYQTLSKTCALSSPPNTHKTRFHQLGNMQWRNVFQLVAMHRFATKWSNYSFFFSYARAWSFSWGWRCLETKQPLENSKETK